MKSTVRALSVFTICYFVLDIIVSVLFDNDYASSIFWGSFPWGMMVCCFLAGIAFYIEHKKQL